MNWNKYFDKAIGKIDTWLETAIVSLPNIIVGVAFFLAFLGIAQMSKRLLRKSLARFSDHTQLHRLISGAISFTIMSIGLLLALNIMHLEKTVFSLLAGVGVVGIALGFAFQDIAANFMAGLFIIVRRPFRVGDLVNSNEYFGTIRSIRLRNTEMRTLSGQVVLIPNKEVFQTPMTNFSESGERRVDLPVGISYGDDLDAVEQVTLDAVSGIEERDTSREVELFFDEFADSSINFVVRFWIRSVEQKEYLKSKHSAIKAIKRAFDNNDITIPFPIRTLDFGIKGGERLTDVVHGRSLTLSSSPRPSRTESASR